MLCEFDRLIYPQSITAVDASSYMIALYHPCEKIKDSTGNTVTQVKAVGYCLPTSSNLRYDMLGHWSKNPKFGVQFEVESYNEVVIPTKEGIIAYLSSEHAVVKEAKTVLFPIEEKKMRNNADGHVLVVSDYEPGADYVYYWGFAWDRADIKTAEAWNRYMADFAQKVRNPMTVSIR